MTLLLYILSELEKRYIICESGGLFCFTNESVSKTFLYGNALRISSMHCFNSLLPVIVLMSFFNQIQQLVHIKYDTDGSHLSYWSEILISFFSNLARYLNYLILLFIYLFLQGTVSSLCFRAPVASAESSQERRLG